MRTKKTLGGFSIGDRVIVIANDYTLQYEGILSRMGKVGVVGGIDSLGEYLLIDFIDGDICFLSPRCLAKLSKENSL